MCIIDNFVCTIMAEIQDEKRSRSLLVPGCLEIAIRMTVFWDNFNIKILQQKISSVNFQEYNEESRYILRDDEEN